VGITPPPPTGVARQTPRHRRGSLVCERQRLEGGELLDRAQAGDCAAFTVLVNHVLPEVRLWH